MFFLINRVFIGIPLKIRSFFHGATICLERNGVNINIWLFSWLYRPWVQGSIRVGD
jgi:hypothetical protein